MDSTPKIRSREELIRALSVAAELEHGLLCQYLFAAFTIRKTDADFGKHPNRQVLQMAQRWEATMLLVARQEMEHLAIVCNLLNAIGGELNFARPNFPQPEKRYPLNVPFLLAPFGVPALRRFIWFEKPDDIKPEFSSDGYSEDDPAPASISLLESLDVPVTEYHSVQQLYEEIRAGFFCIDPAELFIGDTDRQVPDDEFNYRVTLVSVKNRGDAARAIDLIIKQGEGIGAKPQEDSHYQMFRRILEEYEEAKCSIPSFHPALDVVDNPLLVQHAAAGVGTIIHNKASRAGMGLFNAAYHLMLVMLKSWFQSYSDSQNYPRQAAEFYAAFFPLMTMVIRPLGEMLTRMPSGVDGKNAGPSFEIPTMQVKGTPDREWFLCELAELEKKCKSFAKLVPKEHKQRAKFLLENIHATGLHFANLWTNPKKPQMTSHFPV